MSPLAGEWNIAYKMCHGRLEVYENFALTSSLIVLSLTMSFSGGIQFISYRIILFLYMGYSIGRIFFWINNRKRIHIPT